MQKNKMTELKVLSPTAILGYGYPVESFMNGMALKPDIIGVDAGSVDPGPFYLGAGKSFTDRSGVKRDLRYMLRASVESKIPLVIGSAGGSGAAVAVVVAAVFLFAVRHQAEAAAVDVLHIILVTVAILAGIAVALAVAVAGVRRHRRIAELAAGWRTAIGRQSIRALPARQPAAITALRIQGSTIREDSYERAAEDR